MSITLTSHGLTSNIVDTGYGVSQILPVLGQIWWARNRTRSNLQTRPQAPWHFAVIAGDVAARLPRRAYGRWHTADRLRAGGGCYR
jgi:hypothetical protein